ncbi:uncharacterized protein LOC110113205 [Dendrobium catenatum]|uniref:Uncharacterized protein n=1 Tax=Dendrobium catenatum TaxID=906689 RepID=A0A2I0VKG3_9ASPA|nr:uncharacterized protein LOC110113205 [Dendrobium catenatum]PKU63910.1 hypothetical protein MA16_Dca009894 [Dendrobium catenatum]
MARFISQTLVRDSEILVREVAFPGIRYGIITRSTPSQLVSVRLRSSRPKAKQLSALDLGGGSDASTVEVEVLTLKRIEDAIQSFVIKKAAPGWLPFAPGASYWAPPVLQGLSEVDIFHRPENLLTKEEKLSRTTVCGWPSSSYFVDGVIPVHSTMISTPKVTAIQSDDEE